MPSMTPSTGTSGTDLSFSSRLRGDVTSCASMHFSLPVYCPCFRAAFGTPSLTGTSEPGLTRGHTRSFVAPSMWTRATLTDITNTLFSTPMCVALICAFVMDNFISGTATERGLTHWSTLAAVDARKQAARRGDSTTPSNDSTKNEDEDDEDADADADDTASDPRNDPRIKAVYDLPYFLQMLNDRYILPHRRAAHRRLRRLYSAVRWRWRWLTRRIGVSTVRELRDLECQLAC